MQFSFILMLGIASLTGQCKLTHTTTFLNMIKYESYAKHNIMHYTLLWHFYMHALGNQSIESQSSRAGHGAHAASKSEDASQLTRTRHIMTNYSNNSTAF